MWKEKGGGVEDMGVEDGLRREGGGVGVGVEKGLRSSFDAQLLCSSHTIFFPF